MTAMALQIEFAKLIISHYLDQVTKAIVCHNAVTAILSLSGDVDDAVLKQAVEDHDFTLVGIE